MRSAGCIVNDIVDKNFDKKVERTKDRPIASGKVSIKLGLFYTLVLCSLAFLILVNFNSFTILMALASMPLAFTYPLMKRITYWPQLFLGITFNYGLILAWISITNQISIIPIIFLYLSSKWLTLEIVLLRDRIARSLLEPNIDLRGLNNIVGFSLIV